MRVLKRLAFVVFGFFFLLETVPRFVSIPGLERDELAPPYATGDGEKAFLPHPYMIFTPKPGWTRDDEAMQRSHGGAGFRGPDVPLKKPEGTLRIACIGGSSTYGTGPTRDEFTWPLRLEALLEERSPDRPVDIVNAGAPSWTSFECLSNLAFRVLPYAPDIVLVYLATNDAESALWPDPSYDNSHYRDGWQSEIPSPLEATLEKSVTYLVWRRYFTDHLAKRKSLDRYIGKIVPEGPIGETLVQIKLPSELENPGSVGFENFQRNLVSIVAVARAHGARPVLMTQGLYSPAPDSDHLLHGRARVAAQQRMVEIVRAVAAERQVPLVELEPFLEEAAQAQIEERGSQSIFGSNVHLTNEGADLMARRIADELASLGEL